MKKALILAPAGLRLYAERHAYFIDGRYLLGITKKIAKRLGQNMPEDFVGEARAEGVHIHTNVAHWVNTGVCESIHPSVLWVKSYLESVAKLEELYSEVLVSDGKQYASAVDIVRVKPDGTLALFDIKRTFKRVYVSWQLSVYKYLIEKHTDKKVSSMACIAVRDKAVYPIFPYADGDVEELLYK